MTTTPDTELAARLGEIVGPEHLAAPAGVDVDGVPASVAVTPGTLEEAARVLAAAREAGAAVVPWGGGTQQRLGPPPERADVVLRATRLVDGVEWEPADLTASFPAGITLAAVQELLATRGQQIAIDAPRSGDATLGGLVATNTTGPRRWLYGGWRDLIVGMHMALADGTVIKSGGRVVKNVQGYDLAKLFTGSLGTLGVIGRINVKLVPLPETRRLVVGCGDLQTVAAFLDAVAGAMVRASTVDLLDEAAARACGLDGGGFAGLVLIEGRTAVVDAQSGDVARLAAAAGARAETLHGESLSPVWQAWCDLGRTDDLGPADALLAVGALPADAAAAVEQIGHAAHRHGLGGRCWARAGTGAVYARLSAQGGDAPAALAAAQRDLLERWPATTLVAGDPAVERAARPWGAESAGLNVMRALKARFDPARVLQPGRFVGGM